MRITTNRLGYSDLGNSNEFNITLKRDTSNIALGMSIKPTPIEGEGICIETIVHSINHVFTRDEVKIIRYYTRR